ncbi:MAG: CbtA family protein [Janthinobacterium lividum]
MLFQRLVWSGLAAAAIVGSVQTGVQRWQAVPIIQAAEAYESRKTEAPVPSASPASAHVHAHGTAPAWEPAEGAERTFWTWVANLLHAFSMALLVFVAMGVCLWRGATLRSMPLAALVAAAGALSFHVWPSLGLPAEIPGMDAARLGSRQGWWVLAAGSAALACAGVAGSRTPWRWPAAAALLALPFAVGAPHIAADPFAGFGAEAQTALHGLDERFGTATGWIALSFWVSMAVVGGVFFDRWLRPAIDAGFGRTRIAAAPLELKP